MATLVVNHVRLSFRSRKTRRVTSTTRMCTVVCRKSSTPTHQGNKKNVRPENAAYPEDPDLLIQSSRNRAAWSFGRREHCLRWYRARQPPFAPPQETQPGWPAPHLRVGRQPYHQVPTKWPDISRGSRTIRRRLTGGDAVSIAAN